MVKVDYPPWLGGVMRYPAFGLCAMVRVDYALIGRVDYALMVRVDYALMVRTCYVRIPLNALHGEVGVRVWWVRFLRHTTKGPIMRLFSRPVPPTTTTTSTSTVGAVRPLAAYRMYKRGQAWQKAGAPTYLPGLPCYTTLRVNVAPRPETLQSSRRVDRRPRHPIAVPAAGEALLRHRRRPSDMVAAATRARDGALWAAARSARLESDRRWSSLGR